MSLPNDTGISCSVDPVTGNLAVTLLNDLGVAIFKSASGNATVYQTDEPTDYCGYDNSGNLFVDGLTGTHELWLAKLSVNGNGFTDINIDQSITFNPGQVQWDGTYLTLEVGIGTKKEAKGVFAIYRLQIDGSSAHVVNSTTFKDVKNGVRTSWIEGDTILAPLGKHGAVPNLGLWPYPRGGKPHEIVKNAAGSTANFTGVTVSVAP